MVAVTAVITSGTSGVPKMAVHSLASLIAPIGAGRRLDGVVVWGTAAMRTAGDDGTCGWARRVAAEAITANGLLPPATRPGRLDRRPPDHP